MGVWFFPNERRINVPTVEGALLRPSEGLGDEDLLDELRVLAAAHRRLQQAVSPSSDPEQQSSITQDEPKPKFDTPTS